MSLKTELSIDEQTRRNGELLVAFTEGMISGSITDDAPDGAALVLLPDEDGALTESNVRMGVDLLRQGRNVYFRHISSRSTLPD